VSARAELLRVAEDCEAGAEEVAVPIARIEKGVGRPDILRLSRRDPNVDLSDSRYVVYLGQTYLSTLSHLRLARSRDGVHFTVDEKPFLFPGDLTESFGIEDARITDHVEFDPALAIKFTIRRIRPSGSPGDADIFGSQHYGPLLGIAVPER